MSAIAEALHTAISAHQAGKLPEAEAIYTELLKLDRQNPDVIHLLGVLKHQAGDFESAEIFLKEAIKLKPDIPEFHNSLGNLKSDTQEWEEAESAYRHALALNPDAPESCTNLGCVLQTTGRFEEAMTCYQKAVALAPDSPEAHNNLGNGYRDMLDTESALAAYHQAITLDPTFYEAHHNLSSMYQKLEQLPEAILHCKEVIACRPDLAEAHLSLGSLFYQQDAANEAIAAYQTAIRLKPDLVKAYYNLGTMLVEKKMVREASEIFRQSLDYDLNHIDNLIGLGSALDAQGQIAEAITYFERASEIQPDKVLWKWRSEVLSPIIFQTDDAIQEYRDTLEKTLEKYHEQDFGFDLRDMLVSGCSPSFFLSYHGRNDYSIKSKTADIFDKVLQRDYAHLLEPPKPSNDSRIRLGILVSQHHEGVFLKLMRGFINRLPRDIFHITILCSAHSRAYVQSRIEHPDTEYCVIGTDVSKFEETVRDIKAQQFDLLFFYEVGTDIWNYFLPFFNLAPVQCTSFGLPVTTGIPQIHHFVSSELVESPTADLYYREKMFRLKTEPIYFYRPDIATPTKTRAEMGLPEDKNLYICPQNLFKFHPHFDQVLDQVLAADPNGEVVLIRGVFEAMNNDLQKRFTRSISSERMNRIRFMPRLSHIDFLNLLALGDVSLDTLYYTGGTTTYETLSFGTPVVTLPTEHTRGRQSLGNYNSMGMSDCVADSLDDYVAKAVRLGTDKAYHQSIREKILSKKDILFENQAVVDEMQRFLIEATRPLRHYGGNF